MRATNDTLAAFDSNVMVMNESTLPGYMDGGTATWHAQPNMPISGAHFECGDIFNIGKRTVVLASVSRGGPSNSLWWVGDINETATLPTPGVGCAPLPCQSHPGVTFCPTNKSSGQCTTPMPHPPCPPGPCPPPPSPATFITAQTTQEGPCGRVARGSLDYGSWYSAKHGSDSLRTNSSRNLVFGVAGLALGRRGALPPPAWMEQCKRYHTIPRDIVPDLETSLLRITPIPELATLRSGPNHTQRNINMTGSSVQVGSQIEVVLSCTVPFLGNRSDELGNVNGTRPAAVEGVFGVDVLVTKDSREYTRLGVNLTRPWADSTAPPSAFVDTTNTAAGSANQSAYNNPGTNVVPLWQLHASAERSDHHTNGDAMEGSGSATRASTTLQLTVLVDGGMIESFFGEHCPITTLVQPSTTSAPEARYARAFNTAASSGVQCEMMVSKLQSLLPVVAEPHEHVQA
jgi:hypothetical protein